MKKRLAFSIIVLFLLIPSCKETTEPIEPILPDNEEEITIASWNLKNFGQTKLNDSARIDVIVSVLRKYDIIAIQEVQDVSLALPIELIAKIARDLGREIATVDEVRQRTGIKFTSPK